jgi:hypothetical protein
MSHGETKPEDWANLITVRPGPILHIWRSGAEFCQVPLTYHAGLALIGSITAAMQMVERPTTLPNEGLTFEEHLARRDAERATFDTPPKRG